MKLSKERINAAIAGTLNSLYTMGDLAKRTVKRCNASMESGDFELQSTKADSFCIRQAKGNVVTKPFLRQCLVDAIRELYHKSKDDFDEHVSDEYEFSFDEQYINEAFVSTVFTVTANGRILYIEVDS